MDYLHGGDIYRNRVEYDFSVNINPLGMPEKSLQAAQEGILRAGVYPDFKGEELCRAIAVTEGVRTEQIILGNGAAELIYALCYAIRPEKGLLLAPSFQEYEAALMAAGAKTVWQDLKEEEDFELGGELLDAIQKDVDVLFLCNPNNPTGNLTGRELLFQIAEKCEETDTVFCVDECFLPFLEKEENFTLKGSLDRFPHLLVLRAFTKIYGMPGLRLGYAMSANPELLARIRGCLQPWNTSLPAQLAGRMALAEEGYLERTRKLIREEREYLTGELSCGLADRIYTPSANYLFFRSRPDLQALLLREKILIRACGNYRNLSEGYFRIGIRTHAENKELIRRWRKAITGRERE